jgi:hypothetical protein
MISVSNSSKLCHQYKQQAEKCLLFFIIEEWYKCYSWREEGGFDLAYTRKDDAVLRGRKIFL